MKFFHFVQILLLALVMNAGIVFAATPNPGHDASRVGAGSFPVGDFTFQNSLAVNGSTFYVNSTSGNVGIGTVSPGYKLDVNGNAVLGSTARTYSYDDGTNSWLSSAASAAGPGIGFAQSLGKTYLVYHTGQIGVTVDDNGNVGINTTTPSNTLTVIGNANITTITYTPQLCLNGDCKTAWPSPNGSSSSGGWTNTTTQVSLSTSTNNVSANALFVDNTNGRVGVGTATPGERMSVEGAGTANENIVRFNNQGNYASRIWLRNSARSAYFSVSGATADTIAAETLPSGLSIGLSGSPSPIQFFNGASASVKMTILDDGSTGIGTASPGYKLDVNGTLGVTGATTLTSTLVVNGATATFNPDADSQVAFKNAGTNAVALYGGAGDTLYVGGDNTYQFYTGSSAITVADAVNLIVGTGKVGIGTTNPQAKLVVSNGNEGFEVSPESNLVKIYAYDRTNSNYEPLEYKSISHTFDYGASQLTAMTISTTGNVGIGTTTPGTISGLFTYSSGNHVHVADTNYARLVADGGLSGQVVLVDRGAPTNYKVATIISDGGDLRFFRTNDSGSNTNLMTLNLSSGNLGIGATSPQYAVSLTSGSKTGYYSDSTHYSELQFWNPSTGAMVFDNKNGGATEAYQFDYSTGRLVTFLKNGNVGIGVVSPSYKLEVNASSSGDSTFDTIANFKKAATNSPALRVRAKNSLLDLSADYDTGGGGPSSTLTFSTSNSTNQGVERMRIDASGNVGIGTTAPAYTFVVSNGGALGLEINPASSSGSQVSMLAYNRGTASYKPLVIDAEKIVLNTATGGNVGVGAATPGEKLTVAGNISTTTSAYFATTSGNVGIGTTGPGAKLEVVGPAITGAPWTAEAIRFSSVTYPAAYGSIWVDMSGSSGGMSMGVAGARSLYVAQGTGNVGIGDTTPTNKLDVAGAIGISDTTIIDASRNIVNAGTGAFSGALSSATINTGAGAMEVNSIAAYTGNQNLGTGDSPTFVRATMSQATGTAPFTISSTTVVTNLNADTVDGQSYAASWPTTLANIQSATTNDFHNIGGTDDDTPDADGEVPDAITVSGGTIGSNTITAGSAWTTTGTINMDSNTLVVDGANNRVGIGTASPQVALHVSGSNAGVVRVQSTNAFGPAVSLFNSSSQLFVLSTYAAITGSGSDMTPTLFSETGMGMNFATGGSATRNMVIDSSGKVGIGDASPDAKFDIESGNQRFSTDDDGVEDAAGVERLTFDSSGANVIVTVG